MLSHHRIKAFIANVLFIMLSASFGIISVVLPPYIVQGGIKVHYPEALFPIIATGIENARIWPTLMLLFLLLGILGYIRPKIWWLVGLSSMLFFPVVAVVEMNYLPSSHNLWFIEFALYAAAEIPALVGAFVGSRLHNLRGRSYQDR